MKKQNNLSPFLLTLLFLVVAGIIRLLLTGQLPNISPVAAMALFGGACFSNKKIAFALPLLVMFFTDAALELAYQAGWRAYAGFHATMPFVYIGFLLTVAIGIFIKDNVKLLPLLGAGLLASSVFFIVSNFGVWMATGMYPKTLDGLITCYVAAIPFFHYSVIGDLFFTGALFGGYAFVKSRYFTPSAA